MNVIAKISCYLERGVVTLKLRKEYLNSVTHSTSILLRIKYWTVWCIERYSMSTYTGVTNCQKTVRFFGPPCICNRWNNRPSKQYRRATAMQAAIEIENSIYLDGCWKDREPVTLAIHRKQQKQGIHRQTPPRYRIAASGTRLKVQPSTHRHTAHYGQKWRYP